MMSEAPPLCPRSLGDTTVTLVTGDVSLTRALEGVRGGSWVKSPAQQTVGPGEAPPSQQRNVGTREPAGEKWAPERSEAPQCTRGGGGRSGCPEDVRVRGRARRREPRRRLARRVAAGTTRRAADLGHCEEVPCCPIFADRACVSGLSSSHRVVDLPGGQFHHQLVDPL